MTDADRISALRDAWKEIYNLTMIREADLRLPLTWATFAPKVIRQANEIADKALEVDGEPGAR